MQMGVLERTKSDSRKPSEHLFMIDNSGLIQISDCGTIVAAYHPQR